MLQLICYKNYQLIQMTANRQEKLIHTTQIFVCNKTFKSIYKYFQINVLEENLVNHLYIF